MYDLVINGRADCLNWLHIHGYTLPSSVALEAIRFGHYSVAKWLHESGYKIHPSVWCDWSINFVPTDFFDWLREEGIACPDGIFIISAREGRLKLLKWLHSCGFPTHVVAVSAAASQGHLDRVKWLLEIGLPGLISRHGPSYNKCFPWLLSRGIM